MLMYFKIELLSYLILTHVNVHLLYSQVLFGGSIGKLLDLLFKFNSTKTPFKDFLQLTRQS